MTQLDPFERLGLEKTADEASIKRAYARELRLTRPDANPVAFQDLREAYEAALAIVRHGAVKGRDFQSQAESVDADGPTVKSAPENEVQPIDFAGFMDELVTRLDAGDPESLARWLEELPGLYRIESKTAIGEAAHEHFMQHDDRSLNPQCAGVLSEFFALDFFRIVAHAEGAARRARMIEGIEGNDVLLLGERGFEARMALRQLRRPFLAWQAWLATASTTRVAHTARLAKRLRAHFDGALPPGIDPRQADFFERVANPAYFGPWHWATLAARSLAIFAFGVPVGGLSYFLLRDDPSAAGAFWFGILAICALLAAMAWFISLSQWLHLIENRRHGRAAHIARWAPVGAASILGGLAWLLWLPVPAVWALLLPWLLYLWHDRWTALELGALGLGFGLLLSAIFPHHPAAIAIAACLAVITRRTVDLWVATHRKQMLFAVAGNAWSRTLAVLVLCVGALRFYAEA